MGLALRALRLREDAARLARLFRWTFVRRRVNVPQGAPGPPSRALAHLLAGDDRRLDVALGATLIAWEDDPTTDVERVLDLIERLSMDLRLRLHQGPQDPPSKLAILNSYVFDELGFVATGRGRSRGREDRLTDLLLPTVLLRRRGHCVGLSAVYLALAYRADLPLFGVSAPGHFFVRWDGEGFRQNVELTARGAAHPDSYYAERFRIRPQLIDRGVYLQNLRRREVLVEILNNRASFYWDRGDSARAHRDLDRVVSASHNFARAYAGRAFIALQHEQLVSAERDLERALEIDPDYARAHLLLGLVHLRQGRLAEAGRDFERATEEDTGNAMAATYLGRYYAIRGLHDRALEWHERALGCDPRCHTAWNNIGRTRLKLSDPDGARTAFREARRLVPDNLVARSNLILLARKHGGLGGSGGAVRKLCRDFEARIARAPDNANLKSQYVRFLLALDERRARALRLAREVVNQSETTYNLETLARVLLRQGRKALACARLVRALELDADRGGGEAARLNALLAEARGETP